jgi:hypothetical protein
MAETNNDLVVGRKKKQRKTLNEVGKGSEKSDEAEDLTPEDAVNRQLWRKATENQ